MNQENIHISSLSTGYRTKGTTHLLQQKIDARLFTGEITALLGMNGTGKSTLLRTLLGYQPALHGEIMLNETPIHRYTEKEVAKKMAVIFTGRIEESYLTVREMVSMGRYPVNPFGTGVSAHDKQIVGDALSMVAMAHCSEELFSHLSDGEKQRVLLARALAQQTPFILLDEPAAFIDIPGKIAIMELLKEIAHTHHKGILLATHDIELALHYADTIWLLGKKLPFQSGLPEDLALSGVLRDYFSHEDIEFNIKTGKFEKRNKKTQHFFVNVAGSKTEVFWLTKALERNGYEVKRIKRSHLESGIYCQKNKFIALKKGVPDFETDTIAKLMEYLKKSL